MDQFPVLPCMPKCPSINRFFKSFLFPCLAIILSLFSACLVSCDKFILLNGFKIFCLQVFFVSVLLNRFLPFFWGWFGWVFFVFMQHDFFFEFFLAYCLWIFKFFLVYCLLRYDWFIFFKRKLFVFA